MDINLHTSDCKRKKIAPHASILIESMRDIGYSLETAVSDLIDNSITAGASTIEFLANTTSESPAIGILDDGSGMSEEELLEAMRPGTKSPLEGRPDHDLGRFGLGLKTASFSQCRRVTVLTRKEGVTSCAVWDLDIVAEANDWYVEIPNDTASIPWSDRLQKNGTLVVWQKLDRLVDFDQDRNNDGLVRQISDTASHLQLVFHRFLAGEVGTNRLFILLNGRQLEPFDPFHSRHPSTVLGPEEVFLFKGQKILIQPVTLPHHQKVTTKEWEHYAGRDGYTKNQGFYVYREKRLIIYGTWFNLAKQSELTKLSRVRIDIPNNMDGDWKIDVKKASAKPPQPIREHLRRIIEEIGANSKRAYTGRGTKLTSGRHLPVWARNQNKNEIFYGLNIDHPLFKGFLDSVSDGQKREFMRLLSLIESTIPIDAIFADTGSHPTEIVAKALDNDTFMSLARQTYMTLKSQGFSDIEVEKMMSSAAPFLSNWPAINNLLSEMRGKTDNE